MWRADCSRVTHPFAARVPQRALPLDLHVLSTPPAFVLSQDQTLQQKLALTNLDTTDGAVDISRHNHQTGTTPPVRTNKLDTLLSSQKTPAHQHPTARQSVEACSRSCISHRTPGHNRTFHRGVLRGMVSWPGDRSPRGSFCPASR